MPQPVNLCVCLGRVAGTLLAQVPSGDGGQFSAPITIPAATAAGKHTLIAVGNAGTRAIKTITVS